nr:unnamed protein product [Spirometra erinaceieuropaei]
MCPSERSVTAEHGDVLEPGLLFLAGVIRPLSAGSVYSVVERSTPEAAEHERSVTAEHGDVLEPGLLFLAGVIRPLSAGSVYSVVERSTPEAAEHGSRDRIRLPQAGLHDTGLTLSDGPLMCNRPGWVLSPGS